MRRFGLTRLVTVVAVAGSCLAFTGGAAVLTAGPAGAAVSNPGTVQVAFAGSLSINGSVPIVIDGITGTATGTVGSAGNLSFPQGSISFPTFTPTLPTLGPTPVTIEPTADWTGTIDPSSGALTLAAPQSAHLDLSGFLPGDTDCPVGPLPLNLTTGTSGTAMGTPYNSATGVAGLVDGTFAIPAIPDAPLPPNCPDADFINGAGGLPLAGGVSLANLTATFTPVLAPTEGMALAKSADVTSFSTAGTKITYSYKVTNSGSVNLTGLKVTDPMAGLSAINCQGVTTLAPAASVTCTATYTTTQADVTRGFITNTATATATDPAGAPVTSPTSSVTIRKPVPPPTPKPPTPGPAPVAPITNTKVPVTG
jgi:uncharacterized repeat protein (TIGR01451 family)